ncbi:MAG: 23S rRNA (pseudouridine(1915)-N(3))-methyltransferase RlmH [Bacteroidales bacterium]|nr:23S rRNA (pseudouridine(1915)-N(3))-methyltransferase RlmH [Bacteroidales bacterium]
MKISLFYIGKTDLEYLRTGIQVYNSRIGHYIPFELVELSDIKNTKNLSELQQKEKEGELILSKIDKTKFLILLDEKGKEYSSEQFSVFLETKMIAASPDIIFLIGGAYGFSQKVYERANFKIALSKMTFSHQMVRLIFIEQLYRALTIMRGEPYHHK